MATPASSSAAARPTVAAQGGVLEGINPVHYDAKNPIILFIIQASIIIIFCRLLQWPLSKLRQPRVIAEVIGGILLGPSVFGRIPGFQEAISPAVAMDNLNLVANIGLTLFLFIVGLEVDLRIALNNWKVALNVGILGMVLPFGMGAAIAVGLYNEFKDEPGTVQINFGVFMLFIGVATAITAFPVLCRILTELKLLDTPVGLIVLSAGVGNDVVGWILLALCVALVNAGSGLTALWVLLTCVGYTLFLVYLVRPAFVYSLRKTRAIQDGPSQGIVAFTLLLCLASAFFTGIIGVHPIFGAFMAGMICPKENGFNIKVAEKIEDLIGALFLPLYFTLSGLNTNIGLLDSGITWAYVIGVCVVAFSAKFIGAAAAARFSGMFWRECFAIGSLMSCKGLVELIVLNIGLQAKILSTRTFTIFVVMALITTFATSPLTIYFYPLEYQRKAEAFRRGEIDWDGKPRDVSEIVSDTADHEKAKAAKIRRLTIYLRLDSMPNLLAFASLFGGQPQRSPRVHPSMKASEENAETAARDAPNTRPVEAHGVRLLNLSDRGSSVMAVYETESYTANDPIINTFRTFGRMHNLAVSGEALVVPESSFPETLSARASDTDFLLLPWSETGGMSEQAIIEDKGTKNKLAAPSYLSFVNATLERSTVPTAVLINKNFGGPKNKEQRAKITARTYSSSLSLSSHREQPVTAPLTDRGHHVFLPFFGGEDDRAAARLVMQLAEDSDLTATIVYFELPDSLLEQDFSFAGASTMGAKGAESTMVTSAAQGREQDSAFFASLRASIPAAIQNRVFFEAVPCNSPVDEVIERASAEVGQNPKNGGDLVVLGRNLRRKISKPNDKDESRPSSSAGSTLGLLAEKVWEAKLGASVLVVKAGQHHSI